MVKRVSKIRARHRKRNRFFRIAGDHDYMIKIVARDIADFDSVYQDLIKKTELETVTSYIAMEAIADNRDITA
jgi:Lrp/AsnC family transcriptional regulator